MIGRFLYDYLALFTAVAAVTAKPRVFVLTGKSRPGSCSSDSNSPA